MEIYLTSTSRTTEAQSQVALLPIQHNRRRLESPTCFTQPCLVALGLVSALHIAPQPLAQSGAGGEVGK
jgi:hypothetical protein